MNQLKHVLILLILQRGKGSGGSDGGDDKVSKKEVKESKKVKESSWYCCTELEGQGSCSIDTTGCASENDDCKMNGMKGYCWVRRK